MPFVFTVFRLVIRCSDGNAIVHNSTRKTEFKWQVDDPSTERFTMNEVRHTYNISSASEVEATAAWQSITSQCQTQNSWKIPFVLPVCSIFHFGARLNRKGIHTNRFGSSCCFFLSFFILNLSAMPAMKKIYRAL